MNVNVLAETPGGKILYVVPLSVQTEPLTVGYAGIAPADGSRFSSVNFKGIVCPKLKYHPLTAISVEAAVMFSFFLNRLQWQHDGNLLHKKIRSA